MKQGCNPRKSQYPDVYVDGSKPYNRICPTRMCASRWIDESPGASKDISVVRCPLCVFKQEGESRRVKKDNERTIRLPTFDTYIFPEPKSGQSH